MWTRFCDDTFGSISVAAVYTCIGICLTQPTTIREEIVESPASCTFQCWPARLVSSTVFKIEDAHFSITGTCYDCSVIGVGHEFDREDVRMMSRADTGTKCHSFGLIVGIVTPNIEVGIIGTRSKEPTAC